MRSLTELQDQLIANGGNPAGLSRKEIMSRLAVVEHDIPPIDVMRATDTTSLSLGEISHLYFHDAVWCMQPKLDGVHAKIHFLNGRIRIDGRRKSTVTYTYTDRTDNFPFIQEDYYPELEGMVLDTEMMPPSKIIDLGKGKKTKDTLSSAMSMFNSSAERSIELQTINGTPKFYVFDIIRYPTNEKNKDASIYPYQDRWNYIESITRLMYHMSILGIVRPSWEHYNECIDAGFEGVMLRKLGTGYEEGKRSKNLVKIKKLASYDAVITGFIPGNGRNEGKVGSLKVSGYKNGELIEYAQPGGLSDDLRQNLSDEAGNLKRNYYGRVIEIRGQEETRNKRLRHPIFVRWRDDKNDNEVDCPYPF